MQLHESKGKASEYFPGRIVATLRSGIARMLRGREQNQVSPNAAQVTLEEPMDEYQALVQHLQHICDKNIAVNLTTFQTYFQSLTPETILKIADESVSRQSHSRMAAANRSWRSLLDVLLIGPQQIEKLSFLLDKLSPEQIILLLNKDRIVQYYGSESYPSRRDSTRHSMICGLADHAGKVYSLLSAKLSPEELIQLVLFRQEKKGPDHRISMSPFVYEMTSNDVKMLNWIDSILDDGHFVSLIIRPGNFNETRLHESIPNRNPFFFEKMIERLAGVLKDRPGELLHILMKQNDLGDTCLHTGVSSNAFQQIEVLKSFVNPTEWEQLITVRNRKGLTVVDIAFDKTTLPLPTINCLFKDLSPEVRLAILTEDKSASFWKSPLGQLFLHRNPSIVLLDNLLQGVTAQQRYELLTSKIVIDEKLPVIPQLIKEDKLGLLLGLFQGFSKEQQWECLERAIPKTVNILGYANNHAATTLLLDIIPRTILVTLLSQPSKENHVSELHDCIQNGQIGEYLPFLESLPADQLLQLLSSEDHAGRNCIYAVLVLGDEKLLHKVHTNLVRKISDQYSPEVVIDLYAHRSRTGYSALDEAQSFHNLIFSVWDEFTTEQKKLLLLSKLRSGENLLVNIISQSTRKTIVEDSILLLGESAFINVLTEEFDASIKLITNFGSIFDKFSAQNKFLLLSPDTEFGYSIAGRLTPETIMKYLPEFDQRQVNELLHSLVPTLYGYESLATTLVKFFRTKHSSEFNQLENLIPELNLHIPKKTNFQCESQLSKWFADTSLKLIDATYRKPTRKVLEIKAKIHEQAEKIDSIRGTVMTIQLGRSVQETEGVHFELFEIRNVFRALIQKITGQEIYMPTKKHSVTDNELRNLLPGDKHIGHGGELYPDETSQLGYQAALLLTGADPITGLPENPELNEKMRMLFPKFASSGGKAKVLFDMFFQLTDHPVTPFTDNHWIKFAYRLMHIAKTANKSLNQDVAQHEVAPLIKQGFLRQLSQYNNQVESKIQNENFNGWSVDPAELEPNLSNLAEHLAELVIGKLVVEQENHEPLTSNRYKRSVTIRILKPGVNSSEEKEDLATALLLPQASGERKLATYSITETATMSVDSACLLIALEQYVGTKKLVWGNVSVRLGTIAVDGHEEPALFQSDVEMGAFRSPANILEITRSIAEELKSRTGIKHFIAASPYYLIFERAGCKKVGMDTNFSVFSTSAVPTPIIQYQAMSVPSNSVTTLRQILSTPVTPTTPNTHTPVPDYEVLAQINNFVQNFYFV